MENNSSNINVFELITIIFIVLKLCKLIKWSWLWVLSPLWIYAIICFLIILFKETYKNGKNKIY